MANADVFNSGFDSGHKATSKKKPDDNKQKNAGGDDKTGGGIQTKIGSSKVPAFHQGGKVRKTGLAKLKKGEVVLTAAQARQCASKTGKSKSGARKRVTTKR